MKPTPIHAHPLFPSPSRHPLLRLILDFETGAGWARAVQTYEPNELQSVDALRRVSGPGKYRIKQMDSTGGYCAQIVIVVHSEGP